MRKVVVENNASGDVLADNAVLVTGILERMKGLLGRKTLDRGEGMVISPCNSIHTFFMRFSIDAIFYGPDGKVVAAIQHLKPFRATRIYPGVKGVVELPAGTLDTTPANPGDILSITESSSL